MGTHGSARGRRSHISDSRLPEVIRLRLPRSGGISWTLGSACSAAAAVVLTLVEFVGGALLVLGLFTRWAAWLLAIDMVVAILLVHLKKGFFNPQGFEYPLTLLAANIAIALAGPGAASVDGVIRTRE